MSALGVAKDLDRSSQQLHPLTSLSAFEPASRFVSVAPLADGCTMVSVVQALAERWGREGYSGGMESAATAVRSRAGSIDMDGLPLLQRKGS